MKSQRSISLGQLGLVGLCAGSAIAFAVACGDSSNTSTNPTGNPDLAVTPPADMTPTVLSPMISGLSSGADYTKGGTTVTISGSNFRAGATVKFGTLVVPTANTVVSADGKTITVTVPGNLGKPGKVDVVVTNSDSTSATLTKGFLYYLENVAFANIVVPASTAKGPRAVYAVDLDGARGLDLVVVNADDRSVSVFLNDGNGVFTLKGAAIALQVTCTYPYSAFVGDVTGDNKVDLLLPCQSATLGEADFLKGVGDGTFGAATRISLTGANKPQAIVAYDVNGDQMADMVVASNGTNTNNVYAYSGKNDGTFSASPVQAASSLNNIYNLKSFDLNADGKPDLVGTYALAANVNNVSLTLPNPATPTTLMSMGANVYDVASADFDNDGKADLVFANQSSNTFSLFTQGANTAFAIKGTPIATSGGTTATDPEAIAAADLNGDGYADVITANYNAGVGVGDLAYFKGNGQGSFGARQSIPTGSGTANGRPNSVVVADFNGDGRLDIATTNYLSTGGQLVVLLNSGS